MKLNLTGFTIDYLMESQNEIVEISNKLRKLDENKTRVTIHTLTYIETKLIRLIAYLFALNIQEDRAPFRIKDNGIITFDTDISKGIQITTSTSNSEIAAFRSIKKRNTDLPALAEILSKENNANIEAYQNNNTKNINILTNKKPTLKQIVMAIRIYYTMEYDSFSTPLKSYEKMLDAFINDNVDEFNEHINKLLIHPFFIKSEAERYGKIFKYDKVKQLRTIKNNIENIREEIKSYEHSYLKRQQALKTNLEAYDEILNKKDDLDYVEIGKYIINHPYITPTIQSEEIINLNYVAPIVSFDPDAAEQAKKNRTQTAKKILNIFTNHYDEYELYTECDISIHNDMEIQGHKHAATYNSYIGHPHIDNYACYGNHLNQIKEFVKNGDVIGVIDQTTEMVMNMNFYDGPVTDKLIHKLVEYEHIKTWKHKETGVFMSTKEVLEVINGEA